MAFHYADFIQVVPVLEQLKQTSDPIKALSLGYPDLLLTDEDYISLVGAEHFSKIECRSDQVQILEAHGRLASMSRVAESVGFFRLLGIDLEIIDIARFRGDEILVDLNFPLPKSWDRSYDLILDPGTIEHCFNIAQTMENLLKMCNIGGFIYHQNPASHVNHAYFSISPIFYVDFYALNGFEILDGSVFANCSTFEESLKLTSNFKCSPLYNNVVAKRVQSIRLRYPVQKEYVLSSESLFRCFREVAQFLNIISENHDQSICLMPAGCYIEELVEPMIDAGFDNLRVFDRQKNDQSINGIEIESFGDLEVNESDLFVVASDSYGEEIIELLFSLGAEKDQIFRYDPKGFLEVKHGG